MSYVVRKSLKTRKVQEDAFVNILRRFKGWLKMQNTFLKKQNKFNLGTKWCYSGMSWEKLFILFPSFPPALKET